MSSMIAYRRMTMSKHNVIAFGQAGCDEELARMAKALGHPARLAIIRHLAREGKCVCGKIAKIMPLAQSTVSQHLKVLKQAGLILGEVEGPNICYCLNRCMLHRFMDQAAGLLGEKRHEHTNI